MPDCLFVLCARPYLSPIKSLKRAGRTRHLKMEQPTIPPFDAVGAAVAALVTSAAVIIACGYLINWAADFFTSQKENIDQWEK